MDKEKIFTTLFGGFAGCILSVGIQCALPQKHIVFINNNGEKVSITQTEYTDMLDKSESLNDELKVSNEKIIELQNKIIILEKKLQKEGIMEKTTMPTYLLNVCQPYQKNRVTVSEVFMMAGKPYTNGCWGSAHNFSNASLLFNLDGQYNQLSFYAGHVDGGGGDEEITLNIFLDQELVLSEKLSKEMLPNQYEISLSNAYQMKIEYSGCGYGMGNIQVS